MEGLKITDVTVYGRKQKNERGEYGVATVTFNNSLRVYGITVVDFLGKFAIRMPASFEEKSAYNPRGEIVRPVNDEFKRELAKAVIDKFEAVVMKA